MPADDLAMEPPNAMHARSAPTASWSTLNVGEALPGVATPLCWGIWSGVEMAPRASFYAMGALTRPDLEIPTRTEDRILNLFFGRLALRVDFLCAMGDLLPGASGEGIARDIFGFVPPDFVSRPTKRRWPVVAVKMPTTFLRTRSMVNDTRRRTQVWWEEEVTRAATVDLAGAQAMYRRSQERFKETQSVSATAMSVAVQPIFEAVTKLATAAGVDPTTLMQGHGSHEETAMIQDLWAVSRERMTLPGFLKRHGYHGPDEGELSQHMWREDPTPLHKIIESYRGLTDDADPALGAAERTRERERVEAALLAGLPRSKRGGAKVTLWLAGRYLPLRAVAKISFTQSLDVGRAAARAGGRHLAQAGVIDDPEDVFYLTGEELTGRPPTEIKTLIAERKALRERYRGLELPEHWTGQPVAAPISAAPLEADTLTGLGVCPGVVEGTVRVITDPAQAEFEPGDILVAHTTDPSWASVMFLSGALVVDVGSPLSHAAVVAREIGVPCVLNTRFGTQVLHTGDRCRVDGGAGTVEVLERAGTRQFDST
jgi:pyruvate, water dikinase